MNLSRAISQLKLQFGLYGITLPFKNEETGDPIPTENIIRDVITTTTIPMFSQVQPWMKSVEANVSILKCIDKINHIYLLPATLCTTPVLYISDVRLPDREYGGTYGNIEAGYGISRSAQGVITGQAYMMLGNQMRSEPTFEDLGENKVQLFGFPKTVLVFTVACEHEPNGETIPNGCYDSFMQLSTLDMKMFLYNTLKLYDGIPTAFGAIQLKIEDFQGAESERENLLNQWRDVFHLDMSWEKFM